MRDTLKRLILGLGLLLTAGAHPARAAQDGDGRVLVFAASSLTDVMNALVEAYAAAGGSKPALSFAASAALARQIENGAPASLFISADEQWMDYVAARGLIAADTRVSFLGNALVLISPAFALASALNGGKLAMGDPDSVPVGRYGKTALENLGVWAQLEPHVIRTDNVRVALAFVARGEAAAGIVYATDAASAKNVAVVGAFPESAYPPVSYPVAVMAQNDTPAARAFRDFLLSPAARAVFETFGFRVK
jgi:molybdate transport system substrate-binding protein